MRHPLVLALTLLPTSLIAQQTANTVSPGMTKTQVIAALGTPVTSRSSDSMTYVFYKNACGKTCGMNDLVVLRRDSVVDAIFRSPQRHYTGTSSSPAPVPPAVAARKRSDGTVAPAKPMKLVKRKPKAAAPVAPPAPAPARTTPMKPGAANDTRPSIPVNPPALKPAPAPKPAPKTP
jgi:hypothetical protein